LGLDGDKFQTCISEQKYFPQIEQDFKDANFLQIQGTPTWYINNIPVTGHLSPSVLEELISGTLKSLTMPK
jgi:predicted DsbA family dithiol-disulfide isomerase